MPFNFSNLDWGRILAGLGQGLTQAGQPGGGDFSQGLMQGVQFHDQGVDRRRQRDMDELSEEVRRQQLEDMRLANTKAAEQQKLQADLLANLPPGPMEAGNISTASGSMQQGYDMRQVFAAYPELAQGYFEKQVMPAAETAEAPKTTGGMYWDAEAKAFKPIAGYTEQQQAIAAAGRAPAQATEFGAWLDAFRRDNNRNPTAKEIADRDKRLNESIEYKNVIENGKVSTLPVGPDLDDAISRGAIITGTTTQLTEAQAKAGMQFAIAKQANERLDKVEQVLTSPGDYVAAQFGTPGNYVKSPEYQQAEQSARAVAEMYLRSITGAAATEPEIARVTKTILPEPGNDPGTIAQKKAQRQMIVETLRLMSGSMAGQVEAIEQGQPEEPPATQPQSAPSDLKTKYGLE